MYDDLGLPPQRRDNGLRADTFVALADVDPRLGEHLLDLLRLADIPAYLEPPGDPRVTSRYRTTGPIERLFVQSDMRRAAREVVVAAAKEAGAEPQEDARQSSSVGSARPSTGPDLLAGIDTDAEFARMMAGFDQSAPDHVTDEPLPTPHDPDTRAGTVTAAPAPERDDEEHFVPPPAPPMPLPRAETVGALALFVFGLLILARGSWLDLAGTTSFPLGIVLILLSAGLLIRGLRDRGPDDDSDDGAIV